MSTKLTDRSSIPALLEEMTVEEKAALITGYSSFKTRGFEKYGIPSCRVLDGGTGVNLFQYYGDVLVRAIREKTSVKTASLSGVSNSVLMMQILEKLDQGEELTEDEKTVMEVIEEEMKKSFPLVSCQAVFLRECCWELPGTRKW